MAHVRVLAPRGNQRSTQMTAGSAARHCGPHQGRCDCADCRALLDIHERWAYCRSGTGPKATLARWRAPSMRWRSGAWRFDDVIPRTHDASAFDSDDDEGGGGASARVDIVNHEARSVRRCLERHRQRTAASSGGCTAAPHCASDGRHVMLVADAVAEERNGAAGACWKLQG